MVKEKLNIIYQDPDILVLNKPAGLITESQKKSDLTLEKILKKEYRINLPRSGIVHRLDKDTSGLMVAVKNEKAFVSLQNQFAGRKVKKIYQALVLGKLEPEKGVIELALKRDPKNRTRFVASCAKDAREAVTKYEVIKYLPVGAGLKPAPTITYLKAIPVTGRTHQIRAHFFAIGFPIIGDQVYKNKESNYFSKKIGLGHQFLHAGELEFEHPTTGKKMIFQSDLPEDLKNVLDKIQK